MKYVEIYKLQSDGSQKIIATCKQSEDGIVIEGDQKFSEIISREGIRDHSVPGGQALFPKDGMNFLEQLKYNFKSGYLNASDVKEW